MKEEEGLVPARVEEGITLVAPSLFELIPWRGKSLPKVVWLSDVNKNGCHLCGLSFGKIAFPSTGLKTFGPLACPDCVSWILVVEDGIYSSPIGFIREDCFIDYPGRYPPGVAVSSFARIAMTPLQISTMNWSAGPFMGNK